MPYKNPKDKKAHNKRYYGKKLCRTGTESTIGTSLNPNFPYIQYPTYIDYADEPQIGKSFKIGRRRVREYKQRLQAEYPQSEGYSVWINKVEGQGLDVMIWKNNRLDTIMELTNYKKTSNFKKDTAERYLEEFEKYDSVKKIIVVSFPENIEQWKEEFKKAGITIHVEGYQAP